MYTYVADPAYAFIRPATTVQCSAVPELSEETKFSTLLSAVTLKSTEGMGWFENAHETIHYAVLARKQGNDQRQTSQVSIAGGRMGVGITNESPTTSQLGKYKQFITGIQLPFEEQQNSHAADTLTVVTKRRNSFPLTFPT